MEKYRKKPVVIDAVQLTMANRQAVVSKIEAAGYKTRTFSKPPMRAVTGIVIETLEDDMEASYGDFIIKGVNGEFYPCKPEIFEKTYEKVV